MVIPFLQIISTVITPLSYWEGVQPPAFLRCGAGGLTPDKVGGGQASRRNETKSESNPEREKP